MYWEKEDCQRKNLRRILCMIGPGLSHIRLGHVGDLLHDLDIKHLDNGLPSVLDDIKPQSTNLRFDRCEC